MAEPVDLAANADKGLNEIIIANGQVLSHRRAGPVRRLHDVDVIAPGGVGRRLAACHLAKRIGLALCDQAGGRSGFLRAEIGDGAEPVIGPIFRRVPVCLRFALLGEREAARQH